MVKAESSQCMLSRTARISLAGGGVIIALLVVIGLLMPWLPEPLVEEVLPTIETLILAVVAAEGMIIIYDILLAMAQHEETRRWHEEDMAQWRQENGNPDKEATSK